MDEPPSLIFILTIFSDQSLLYFLLLALFLFFSGWASAVEAAFFSLHSDEVGRFQNSNDIREKRIALLAKEPRLLLNTLTTCKYLALSATAVITIITIASDSTIEANDLSAGTSFLITTVTFALGGVILAKIIGTSNNVSIARANSKMTSMLVSAMRPIVKPLLRTSVRVERMLHSKSEENVVEELTQALQLATVDNDPIEGEKEILEGIVTFGTMTVRQVMKPKSEISFTTSKLDFFQLMEFVNKSGFSRVPIAKDTLDSVEGFLYIKDLLPFLDAGPDFQWMKLLRPAYAVQDTRKIDSLLKEFQEKRVHMALVKNTDGIVVGIITLEDIIEEIIGDINDEFDEPGVRYQRLNENNYLFDGKISIHEFCRVLNIDTAVFQPVKGINESLNGVLVEVNGELPSVGDKIVIGDLTFIVESVDFKKVKKVRVQIHEEASR
ncbi:MAG TPA: CNNM domain-containing protein [Chryseosolibacter sp.]